MNYHFGGDVSAWFYTYLAGMHELPGGKLYVKWERNEGKIILLVKAPECVKIRINLPKDHQEEILTILEEK